MPGVAVTFLDCAISSSGGLFSSPPSSAAAGARDLDFRFFSFLGAEA